MLSNRSLCRRTWEPTDIRLTWENGDSEVLFKSRAMKPSYPDAVSGAARKGSILGLFTGVRGRGVLRGQNAAPCITPLQLR